MYNNKLIYGKDLTQRIVNVEIDNDKATLFIENEKSEVSKEVRKNKFWVLTNKPFPRAHKLKGDLHYKYGIQFVDGKDRSKFLYSSKKDNLDVFTIWDDKEQYLVKDGLTTYKGMKHTEPTVLSFDIESTTLFHTKDAKVLLISNTFRKNGEITRRLFCYDNYSSQGEMLVDWCKWVRELDPSLIVGHNVYGYDIPYLKFIADNEGVELNLGRDGSDLYINPRSSDFRVDGSRSQKFNKVRIYGRDVIDTMFLAIKHDIAAKKYESYGLKAIIKTEGLEKKDRVFYDSSTIRTNYTDPVEWEKIKQYCIHDSDDGLAVYDLTAPAFFYLTQSVPKSFQSVVESATGSQINAMMIRSYLQEGHSIPKADAMEKFDGAISLGSPGKYKNCIKWDVASLYPSIILECKVYDKDKDPQGNFLKIMEELTKERLKNKRLAKETGDPYYEALQNAQKIVINSGYGFLGAPGLNFNCRAGADFVTKTGREILSTAIEWATGEKFVFKKNG